jgi:hypothetical protein
MIQALAPNRSDQAFDVGVLPWRLRSMDAWHSPVLGEHSEDQLSYFSRRLSSPNPKPSSLGIDEDSGCIGAGRVAIHWVGRNYPVRLSI